MLKIVLLTGLAMAAFAANSILARLGMGSGEIDPLQYTAVRLISGALALFLLLRLSPARTGPTQKPPAIGGSWPAALALFGYAILFSLAYIALGAGVGALILFASVQIGMLGWAIVKGDRPGLFEWLGLIVAALSFAFLVSPALVAPDPAGTALMVAAGLCWAVYSLLGRGSKTPLADTTGNFLRSVPLAAIIGIAGLWLAGLPGTMAIYYALASGIVASGLGYAIWYAALPALSRTRAAIVQLSVPAIAALGGVLFIAEPLTPKLVVTSIGILGGIAMALLAGNRRKATAS